MDTRAGFSSVRLGMKKGEGKKEGEEKKRCCCCWLACRLMYYIIYGPIGKMETGGFYGNRAVYLVGIKWW